MKLLDAELKRVVNITKQTLQFYRQGKTLVPIDLTQSINSAIDLLARKAASSDMKIETDFRTSAVVSGYQGELRQVFANLIVNAMEAGATVVKIRVSRAINLRHSLRRGAQLIFADNGSGIPGEVRQKIFEPFFTTKDEKGTGLGLWVSRGIIQKHEGWIRLRSSTVPDRRGTSFCIFLPAAIETIRS
jgi:signal transduction histidine kinase